MSDRSDYIRCVSGPLEAKLCKRIAELDGELDAVSAAIGTVRFMDPPDGGSVSLAEQVRRMRAALDEAEAKLATAVASLDDAAEYVERFADMRDGDYGAPEPNEAMQLAHSLRQTLASIQERT